MLDFEVVRRGVISSLLLLVGACEEPDPQAEDELISSLSAQSAKWVALDGDLNPAPDGNIGEISLSASPRFYPIIAFSATHASTLEDQTHVLNFNGDDWESLGAPLSELGPSVAIDSQKHVFVCTGGNGPFVRRWNGSTFVSVGGNISDETGYRGTRYSVYGCGGIVFDSSGAPIVVWSADVGAKANTAYAARFDRGLGKWVGLGPSNIGSRATEAHIDIDLSDRPHVVTYTPGGSYGGGATTRVFRWGGAAWQQLGADMPNTADPVIGVYDNSPYLSLRDNASGTVRVARFRQGSWQDLPSPGSGELPALGFTVSGKPISATLEEGAPSQLRVRYFSAGRWSPVGAALPLGDAGVAGELELTLDTRGRPILAWNELDGTTSSVFVRRLNAALP